MMLGRRQKLSGDEVDAISRKARDAIKSPAGVRKKQKKKVNKRERKEAKKEIKGEMG